MYRYAKMNIHILVDKNVSVFCNLVPNRFLKKYGSYREIPPFLFRKKKFVYVQPFFVINHAGIGGDISNISKDSL